MCSQLHAFTKYEEFCYRLFWCCLGRYNLLFRFVSFVVCLNSRKCLTCQDHVAINDLSHLAKPLCRNLLQMNGVTSAFIATRTGLTRWMDFASNSPGGGAVDQSPVMLGTTEETVRFVDANSGATNELWYRRAVER